MYIPQPPLRTRTHQPQTSLLLFQYFVPKYIKALMSWQRRKQTYQQTLMDRTVFCKYLAVYVGYRLAKIIKYKCPIEL